MKKFLFCSCIALGLLISGWATYLQSEFLSILGVSKFGALSIEPLLIVCSFLIGFKISKSHRLVSIALMSVLTIVSLTTILSTYLTKTNAELEAYRNNQIRIEQSAKNETLIRNTVERFNNKNLSSKNTVAAIKELREQEKSVETKNVKSELVCTIEILSKSLMMSPERATFLIAFLLSLTAVLSPSFLFFSAGLILAQIREEDEPIKKPTSDELIEIKTPNAPEITQPQSQSIEVVIPKPIDIIKDSRKELSPFQKKALKLLTEYKGDKRKVAQELGMRYAAFCAQIAKIKKKGWEIPEFIGETEISQVEEPITVESTENVRSTVDIIEELNSKRGKFIP